MAHYCGLFGKKGHESVSKWERGLSVPKPNRRTKFIDWLCDGLGLRDDKKKLYSVWEILEEEWGWEALNDEEQQRCFQSKEICPYRGLAAFTETDVRFFHGRQRVIYRLLESLRREPRFLAVLGPSGSGKSSVIQAGLIPQLQQGRLPDSENWGFILTRPADHPFRQLIRSNLPMETENLTTAIQDWLSNHPSRTRVMLVIDQFEELLVVCPRLIRQAFLVQLERLLNAPLPITIILVIRDDFYSHFAQQAADLLSWIERGLVNIPPTLEQDELLTMVQEPAKIVGLKFETGLVKDIVNDARRSALASEVNRSTSSSTVLPLLEFALQQLWTQRKDGILTHDGYSAIGGLTGALTQWADRAFYSFEEEQRPFVRRILTNLVYLGDDRQTLPDSRWRRPLTALYRNEREKQTIHQIVRQLANARLIITSRDVESRQENVELIHDTLLREWNLFQQWLKEDRQFLVWRQSIQTRIRGWVETSPDNKIQRDEGRLLWGRDLTEAEDWQLRRDADLIQMEQDYVQASRERQTREEQRWKDLYEEAERQRHVAIARQLAAQAELIRNQVNYSSLQLSILLALESMQRLPTIEAYQTLHSALAFMPRLVAYTKPHDAGITDMVITPDGEYVVTASHDETVRTHKIIDGREVTQLPHSEVVVKIRFSPNMRYLATASRDETIRIWDLLVQREISRFKQESLEDIDFSPDGQFLATASRDGTARVWEVRTGREIVHVTHRHDDNEPHIQINIVRFSSTGQHLATGGDLGTVQVWETTDWKEIASFKHGGYRPTIAFSPDARYLVTGGDDSITRIWKTIDWQEISHQIHDNPVFDVAFSPDSKYLATTSTDGIGRVWETTTGRTISRIATGNSRNKILFSPNGQFLVTSGTRVWEIMTGREILRTIGGLVALSLDGQYLITADDDGSGRRVKSHTRIWKATDTSIVARLDHKRRVKAISFMHDGRYLATTSDDNVIHVWNVTSMREVMQAFHPGVSDVAFSPDGRYLASAGIDKIARIFELDSGQEVARLNHSDSEFPVHISAVNFSPDGKYLATASGSLYFRSDDDRATVWEVSTGLEIVRIGHNDMVADVAFSTDGHYLATASRDRTVQIWEVTSNRLIARLVHPEHVRAVSFHPSGQYLAALGGSVIIVWDLATGKPIHHFKDSGCVDFSSDGCYLATGRSIWDFSTGQEVARINEISHTFSPDGRYLAVMNSEDQSVQLWLWHPDDLISEACARLTRNMTQEEWHKYLSDEPYHRTCPHLSLGEGVAPNESNSTDAVEQKLFLSSMTDSVSGEAWPRLLGAITSMRLDNSHDTPTILLDIASEIRYRDPIRRFAANLLRELEQVGSLVAMIKNSGIDDMIRTYAVALLVELHQVDDLVILVRNPTVNSVVQEYIIEILRKIQRTDILLDIAFDHTLNANVRWRAAKAAGELGQVDALLMIAGDSQLKAILREGAAHALRELGWVTEATQAWLLILEDIGVLNHADLALPTLKKSAQDLLIEHQIREQANKALSRLNQHPNPQRSGMIVL